MIFAKYSFILGRAVTDVVESWHKADAVEVNGCLPDHHEISSDEHPGQTKQAAAGCVLAAAGCVLAAAGCVLLICTLYMKYKLQFGPP